MVFVRIQVIVRRTVQLNLVAQKHPTETPLLSDAVAFSLLTERKNLIGVCREVQIIVIPADYLQ